MSAVSLDIEPGVTLRFSEGSVLMVDAGGGGHAPSGVLRAVGTAEAPVVFTSAADQPAPGDWRGIWFGGDVRDDNRLEHARVEYAGADCSCSLSTCNVLDTQDAAIHLLAAPGASFIQDVTIAHVDGHGVFRGWAGPASPSFVEGNAFEDVSGCLETTPALPDVSCPSDAITCE